MKSASKLLTIFLAFLVTFYSTFLAVADLSKVYADGPVPGEDCAVKWSTGYPNDGDGIADDYTCYIRGILVPTTAFGYTHRITYSGGTPYWNVFTQNPQHTQYNNQEVVLHVAYTNQFGGFNIISANTASTYNQAPSQPNLTSPQGLEEIGPSTDASYAFAACNPSGTGIGCDVTFNGSTNDPDFYNFLNNSFEVNSTQGGNQNFTTSGQGGFAVTKHLNDGNWRWRGISTDPYTNSGWTGYRNFIVDTTAPTQPQLNNLQTYSPGTQLNVSSTGITDDLIGGIEYEFQKADDNVFTTNSVSSGWISANNFTFAGLTDGTTYYYKVRARDKLWNTTSWSTTKSSIQDAILPALTNLTINEQRISPQNQDSIKDSSQIDLDWGESNPKETKVQILDLSNNLVREFVEDTSASVPDSGHTAWSWDGKNSSNTFVADATYNVKIILTDQAGQQTIDNSQFIIIDNTPATLNVNQATGAWYNSNNIGITGQTENNALLKITNTATGDVQNITPNSTTGLFGINPEPLINFAINLGANLFQFEVNDQVGNIRTDNYTYYREEVSPTLNINSLGSLTNNRKPTITLTLTDTGYNDGTNDYISGIEQGSVYLEIQHDGQSSQVLVNNGANVASSLGNTTTNCNTAGSFGASGPVSCTFSFVFNNDLQPDGNYTITARTKDKAGNQSSNATTSFELDSNTHNVITQPGNGNLFNYSLIQLKGTAEKDTTMQITVPDVNGDGTTDSETFIVNEATTGGRVTVNNCRATANPTTDGVKEICDWVVDNFQLEKDQVNNINISNPISFKVTDTAGNSNTQVVTVNVNVHAVTLTVSSDLQYFSPNGDGKQDGVNFSNLTTSGILGDWKLEIKDSNNNIVKDFTGNVSLPTNVPWDGRDSNTNFLTDGNYTFVLSVTTTDGVTFSTTPQPLQAVTSLTNQIIITYPGNDTFTNQGVTAVQGIAPVNTKVRICIDVIGMSASCDYEVNDVSVNSDSTFSVLVPIFRINGQSSTQNFLSATASDKYGNTSPESNKVKITLTTNTPFQSIEIVPAYVGINTSSDYQAILDKLNNNIPLTASDIQSIRYTNFRSVVNQGAERVKFSYADYTNLSDFPSPVNYNYIGYATGDSNIHLNEAFTDGSTAYTQCNAATCTWDFLYPVPPVPGGLYEIKFDGKLGGTIQTLTSALILDGNVPAAPLILDIDKIIGTDQLNTNIFQNKYYSNSETIVIRGVSDGGAAITVKDQNGNTVCTTTSSSIGFWSCQPTLGYTAPASTYSLSVEATLGLNTATSLTPTTLIIDKQNPQITDLSTAHGLSTEAWYRSGDLVDTSLTADEMLSYAFNRDGSTLSCAGSSVQAGAITDFNETSDYLGAKGSYTIPGTAPEGRYCTEIEIQDIAGNRTKQDMVLLIDNTTPNIPIIDKTTWGLFNGINTQPQYIAKGRLNPEFVHEEDAVTIFGYAEENQMVELYVDGTKRNELPAADHNFFGVNNCKSTLDSSLQPLASDDVKDTVIVQYQYQCLYGFIFNFDQGEKGYTFQVKARDMSGNISQISEDEVIYYDKTAPRLPETFNVMANNNTIPDWIYARNQDVTASNLGTGNFGRIPITNSKNIKVVDYSESLSDMMYTAVDKNGATYSQFVKQKSGTGFDPREYVMTAGDGVYTFYAQSWDAPGNVSGIHMFQIELDTIAPGTPNVSGGMSGLYNIVMNVSGEPGSTSTLGKLPTNGFKSGIIRVLDINRDSDWETTMTFCSNLTDRAGNRSASRCFSVNTPVRPPRLGECELNETQQEEIRSKTQNGEIQNQQQYIDVFNSYFSKSCLKYEIENISEKFDGIINNAVQDAQAANSCIEKEMANKCGKDKCTEQLLNEKCELNKKLVLGISTDIYSSVNLSNNLNKCLSDNFDKYCHNGGCHNITNASNDLAKQCYSDNGLNFDEESNKQNTIDQIKDQYQKYKDQYKRGNFETCEATWQIWKDNSCVATHVKEGLHIVSEVIGFAGSVILYVPIGTTIATLKETVQRFESLQKGEGGMISPDQQIKNHIETFDAMKNGISSAVTNVVTGVGDFAKSLFELPVHAGFYIAGGIAALVDRANNYDAFGNGYNATDYYEFIKKGISKDFGYDVGDVKDDLFKSTVGLAVAGLTYVTGGAIAGLLKIASSSIPGLAIMGATGALVGQTFNIAVANPISLKTGLGQFDYYNNYCENSNNLNTDPAEYDLVCENSKFSYDKFLKNKSRDETLEDIGMQLCGKKVDLTKNFDDLSQCIGYQSGTFGTSMMLAMLLGRKSRDNTFNGRPASSAYLAELLKRDLALQEKLGYAEYLKRFDNLSGIELENAINSNFDTLLKPFQINITNVRLDHIFERHVEPVPGKSTFNNTISINEIIRKAEQIAPIYKQENGNWVRIIKMEKEIGFDRSTNSPTNIVTIITDSSNNLITAFPGNP